MPDHRAAIPLQQRRHLGRCQEAQPRLAALSGNRGDQIGVGGAGLVAQIRGEQVVGDELGPRSEAADLGDGLADGGLGQVHGHAQPAHEGRPHQVESAPGQRRGERIGLEVARHEDDVVRHRDPGRGQPAALDVLTAGVIDLEYPDPAGQDRAVGERVEPGTQDQVLGDATADGRRQAVLGVPAAAGDLSPRPREYHVLAVLAVIARQLIGRLAEQRERERIGEDQRRPVDDEVRRPRGSRRERGLTRCRNHSTTISN